MCCVSHYQSFFFPVRGFFFYRYQSRFGSRRLDEAAQRLAEAVNRDDFVSRVGKTKHKLWSELCDLISTHPLEARSTHYRP